MFPLIRRLSLYHRNFYWTSGWRHLLGVFVRRLEEVFAALGQSVVSKVLRYNTSVPASYRRVARDIVLICIRSVASLSNAIIFVVLGLLFYFNEKQTAIFLSIAIVLGVLIGVVNDIRARLALERLQLLTTPIFTRLGVDGTEERAYAEALERGDRIKLVLGDQVPCDSTIQSASNFEISQALLTGESDSFPKKEGEAIMAGDIVVAGSAIARIDAPFSESHLSKMTSAIKRYSVNLSPIQQSIQTVIQYSGWAILALLSFVVLRGYHLGEPLVQIVQNAAALTSTLVPQGLMVATTILFAYGAIRLFQEQVLLQDVNATEKLGRIKTLCIDKTGTLTENMPTVTGVHVFGGVSKDEVSELAAAYIRGTGDMSETVRAIARQVAHDYQGEILEALPFTSQRQYGAVRVRHEGAAHTLVMGGPDTLLSHVADDDARQWLENLLAQSKEGGRLVCIASTEGELPKELSHASLTPIAVYELESKLREGTRDIIEFLQGRGIHICIISGDNPKTVAAIAKRAGIRDVEASITGPEMEGWTAEEFETRASHYTIFARIRPELKEKIITALKKSGFTAMIGDGANDALAIKESDLGIAMFEGATATRQLASVVLMNNSFAALPKGMRMADTIIGNIETISSLYFFEMALGLVLFLGATVFGYAYPLLPQNIVLINYFTVGFPGIVTFAWTMRNIGGTRHEGQTPFLKKVLPFALWSGLAAGVCTAALFVLTASTTTAVSNTAALIAFVLFSLVFFYFAPSVYGSAFTQEQKRMVLLFGAGELLLLGATFLVPMAKLFFAVTDPTTTDLIYVAVAAGCFTAFEYLLAKRYSATV